MSRFAVLAHNQPASARPTTFIEFEAAQIMLQRMIAEKISARVIRMFPPESVFLASRPELPPALVKAVTTPKNLGSGEVANCKFRTPQSPEWQKIHLPPTRVLRARVKLMQMVLGYQGEKLVFQA